MRILESYSRKEVAKVMGIVGFRDVFFGGFRIGTRGNKNRVKIVEIVFGVDGNLGIVVDGVEQVEKLGDGSNGEGVGLLGQPCGEVMGVHAFLGAAGVVGGEPRADAFPVVREDFHQLAYQTSVLLIFPI